MKHAILKRLMCVQKVKKLLISAGISRMLKVTYIASLILKGIVDFDRVEMPQT